jgi:hypothetical protein
MAGDPGRGDIWDSPVYVVVTAVLVGAVIFLGGWALQSMGARM